jgi:hypothetical protein
MMMMIQMTSQAVAGMTMMKMATMAMTKMIS